MKQYWEKQQKDVWMHLCKRLLPSSEKTEYTISFNFFSLFFALCLLINQGWERELQGPNAENGQRCRSRACTRAQAHNGRAPTEKHEIFSRYHFVGQSAVSITLVSSTQTQKGFYIGFGIMAKNKLFDQQKFMIRTRFVHQDNFLRLTTCMNFEF